MSMKLYILDCGQMWVEKGFLWHFGDVSTTDAEYHEGAFGRSEEHTSELQSQR